MEMVARARAGQPVTPAMVNEEIDKAQRRRVFNWGPPMAMVRSSDLDSRA
jgi:hypothetical protein